MRVILPGTSVKNLERGEQVVFIIFITSYSGDGR